VSKELGWSTPAAKRRGPIATGFNPGLLVRPERKSVELVFMPDKPAAGIKG
jgi:hypothetical protein